jgi:cytochrome c oxidase subunit IV
MAETTAHGPAHPESHAAHAAAAVHEEGQHHPLRVYFIVWGWLFVLSACSYMVDYVGLQGYLRWSLILIFMLLKAGLIVAVFMHMVWERRALAYAILMPMFAVLVFIGIMAFEADYTALTRFEYFGDRAARKVPALFRQADAHAFARQAKGHKHRPAILHSSNGVATIRQAC